MADTIWQGNNSDWTQDANWSGVQPADSTDKAHFTGASNVDVAGLTPDATHDQISALNLHPGWKGSIGSSGSKLIMDTITDVRFHSEGGKLFLDSDGTGFARVVVSTAAGVADMFELDGTTTDLWILSSTGSMTITSGAAITNIWLWDSPSFKLTIEENVTGITQLRMNSGRIINNSAITQGAAVAVVTGGVLEQRKGAIDDLWILEQGTCIHTDGTSASINVLFGAGPGALFDGTQNKNPPTITIATAHALPGFTALLRNTMVSYAVTTARDLGGSIDVSEVGGILQGPP